MCIGIPMQVTSAEPGFACCTGRGEQRRVSTLLVGDCALGDWLLVFLDDARERISAERAGEIDSTLDLLERALNGASAGDHAPGFLLPSSMPVSSSGMSAHADAIAQSTQDSLLQEGSS
ncbi:hypothetical protein AEMCBJ_32375 (plasmid) [Cupriavidus necator]|uniref:HypC/HybG/HupF family hydrogenase formation chaperone n=1 Tax=Cupriavidus necator TaxID=106590 RepID=UPI003F7405FD